MTQSVASTVVEPERKVAELQAFISGQRDGREMKKALAVKLLYQGHSYEPVVRILDVSIGSITNWKNAYEASGLAGFAPRHKGSEGYLSAEEKAAVIKWLEQKSIWTLNELEYELAERYGVETAKKCGKR